uniref:Si:ch73-223p23.2 n=1 Tax=Cyprinus carpio TaxID=7962 RepID=A0A8C2PXZ6_CYPCA
FCWISKILMLFFCLAQYHRNKRCTEVTVNASLKSEVFLPCHFNISHHNETEWVYWSYYSSNLVMIMINGRIFFDSPSQGRVSSFPNLARGGNFSILIHELQSSDTGTYLCELNSECWRVKISELPESKISPFSETKELNSWLFFFAGVGVFILLFIIFSLTVILVPFLKKILFFILYAI